MVLSDRYVDVQRKNARTTDVTVATLLSTMAYPRDSRLSFFSFLFSFLPSVFPLPPRDSIHFFRLAIVTSPCVVKRDQNRSAMDYTSKNLDHDSLESHVNVKKTATYAVNELGGLTGLGARPFSSSNAEALLLVLSLSCFPLSHTLSSPFLQFLIAPAILDDSTDSFMSYIRLLDGSSSQNEVSETRAVESCR